MYYTEINQNAIKITNYKWNNEMIYSNILTQSCIYMDMRYIKQREYENMPVTVTKPKYKQGE